MRVSFGILWCHTCQPLSNTNYSEYDAIFEIHFFVLYFEFFSESVDPAILEKLKKEQRNKDKLIEAISSIITYTIYLFLLVSLATTLNGQTTYRQKHRMENLVQVKQNSKKSRT